jgi:DNA polymerase I-like protein with 3'-5' exonuclease and polymerase domains
MAAAEMWVAALASQDAKLLELLRSGASPHPPTGAQLFGRPIDKHKDDEEYTFAKSTNYRFIYTHPDRPISLDPGQLRTYRVTVTPEALARTTAWLNSQYPGLVAYKRKVIRELLQTGLAHNPWGRYRDLSWAVRSWSQELREHAAQAALNFGIQTAIGEVMNDAFVKAWDILPAPARLIIQCHDELVAFTPLEGQVPAVAAALRGAIEQPVPELGGAVLPAEVKVGPTWGEMKPYAR